MAGVVVGMRHPVSGRQAGKAQLSLSNPQGTPRSGLGERHGPFSWSSFSSAVPRN